MVCQKFLTDNSSCSVSQSERKEQFMSANNVTPGWT